jgi:hypothetical protein
VYPQFDHQVDYVETIMRKDALEMLRRDQAVDMAAFDSAGASLFLTKAYNEKEKMKLVSKLVSIETDRGLVSRWSRDSPLFKAGLGKLRDRKMIRYWG